MNEKNRKQIMTSKNLKTVLFAGLIATMILPFSMGEYAIAEETVTTGKDIVKNYKASEAMPQFEDVKEKHKNKSEEIQRYEHQKEHTEWIEDHLDEKIEQIVREKQDLVVQKLFNEYQVIDANQLNYFPVTSIGYDYEDNALEITIIPEEFENKDLKKYKKIIRSIVGNEIDVTYSPMEAYELVSCDSRTNCDDLKAGVEIGMDNKNFPCTLGFAATYDGKSGFVTAGHCFDGSSVGNDAYHPEDGSKIGDLVKELVVSAPRYSRCDCAFVEASGVSDLTYGISTQASSVGSSTYDKSIQSSLGNSNKVSSGVITDNSRAIIGYYYKLLGVVETDIRVQGGDSGSPVFNSSGSELLGFMVSTVPGDSSLSAYVKADTFSKYLSGLQWDF